MVIKRTKRRFQLHPFFFESMPYQVNNSGYIDYVRLEENAALFRPKLLICGASAYPREFDYPALRKVADKHGAYLLCDMAHISGLVAAGVVESPFKYCDVVTTTTHKTLRGPRAGLIFFRKNKKSADGAVDDLEGKVNFAVFPSIQGGPHENTIAAVAVALKEAATEDFKQYGAQVKKNAARLGEQLAAKGYSLVTGGTDNHLVLWDLRPQGLTGSKVEKACDLVSISVNKNAVYGDTNAISPGGVRVGAPALTSRGFVEKDFDKVAEFLDRVVKICVAVQEKAGKKLTDFAAALEVNEELKVVKKEVEEFSQSFAFPGL